MCDACEKFEVFAVTDNGDVDMLSSAIQDFHNKFELSPAEKPSLLPDEVARFRKEFLREECMEYEDAVDKGDLEKALDALVDLVYVAIGTAYLHRFRFAEAFRRVHEKNMEKVRAQHAGESARGTSFDVVKPEGWTPPNHSDLVESHPWS